MPLSTVGVVERVPQIRNHCADSLSVYLIGSVFSPRLKSFIPISPISRLSIWEDRNLPFSNRALVCPKLDVDEATAAAENQVVANSEATQRRYFHVMPPGDHQLENWHRYLDFVEMQEDFEQAVKLYEKMLYLLCCDTEFWMRNLEFKETEGGRELAKFALFRSTKVFLKGIRLSIVQLPNLVLSSRQLSVQIAHLMAVVTQTVDCRQAKIILKGLICFLMTHIGLGEVNIVEPIIGGAISPLSDASQGLGNRSGRYIGSDFCIYRSTSSNKLPTAGTQLLDNLMVRRKNPFPMPFRPSEGSTSDQRTQPQMQEQGQSTHENQPSNPNQVSTSQIQRETIDNNVQERTQQASLKIAEPCVEDEPLVNKTGHGSEHQSGDDARGQLESTSYMVQQSPESANEPVGPARGLVPQNVGDACGPKVPAPSLIHQPGEDAYEPAETAHGLAENTTQPTHDLVHQIADVDSFADASQRDMDSIYVEKELDPESKQHVKLFPLDRLYLNSQDKGYGDSTPMSSSVEQSPAFNRPENYLKAKGSPSIVSPASTISCDLAQIEIGPVKLSSGDARSGFHPDTENRPHKKLRVAPNKQSPPAEMNAQMVNSQGDSHIPLNGQIPQVQGNSTTTHSWPPQNLRQQSFVSENQSLPQAQMAQFRMQSAGQYGMVADNQVYNQMIENYFQQQQCMIPQLHYQERQQFMQQQQVQQPYQQQQHHHLYLQQQLPQLSYQQLLQLQEQQAQLMQQQQQHQFYNPLLQPQEQNPMQRQQVYQQHQQMQHHPQIISPQIPTWNGSYYQQQSSQQNFGSSHSRVESGQQFAYQVKDHFDLPHALNGVGERTCPAKNFFDMIFTNQKISIGSFLGYMNSGQQVMSPHSASASEFPNPQQQSRGIIQPHHAAASGSSVSPHNQLQPSRGVTPHGAAASGSAVSPHNQLQSYYGVTPHGAGASRPSSSSYNQQHHRK
ncbi:hypothetical protein RHMOL_Rhmol13G0266800 [Rhododendron molle]|uniref:Uncharacterized protein n=1 Tax=Rhododendron molle TaxID=49168 RepID=A0ACC0LB90_RHOML|nr:hypothetical protein RHMOL_Rhmol13G0266800 [Rhododendron molle]